MTTSRKKVVVAAALVAVGGVQSLWGNAWQYMQNFLEVVEDEELRMKAREVELLLETLVRLIRKHEG